MRVPPAGPLAAGGGGAAVLAAAGDDAEGFRGVCMALTTTAGLAAGALPGAIVGRAQGERWQPVRHRQRAARLRVVPPAGRPGAGLAVARRL